MSVITRETKTKSYEEIKQTLANRQSQVFNELIGIRSEPITASELSMKMWQKGVFNTPDRNNVHPRLNELVEFGFVNIIGKRRCNITNKTVATYSVL